MRSVPAEPGACVLAAGTRRAARASWVWAGIAGRVAARGDRKPPDRIVAVLLCRVLLCCALWFRALWFRALWFRALWFRALWFPGRGFSRTDVPGSRPLLRALLLWGLLGRLWLRGAAGGGWTAPAPGLQQRLLVEAARLPDLLIGACRAVGLPRLRWQSGARGPEAGHTGTAGGRLGRGWGGLRVPVFGARPHAPEGRRPEGGVLRGGPHGALPLAGALGLRVLGARVLEAVSCPSRGPAPGPFSGVRSLGVRVLGAAVLGRVPRVGRTRGACCFRPSFTRSDLGRACVRYDGARRMIRARAVALLFVRWGR